MVELSLTVHEASGAGEETQTTELQKVGMNSLAPHMTMADQTWSLNVVPRLVPCFLLCNFMALPSLEFRA